MKKILLLCLGLLTVFSPLPIVAETIDTTAPIISQVRVPGSTLFATSAQISWQTDDQSDSRAYYYGAGVTTMMTALERCDGGGYVTNHCIILRNLTPLSNYYYKVESVNTVGLLSNLSGFTFTTLGSTSDTSGSSGSGAGTSTTTQTTSTTTSEISGASGGTSGGSSNTDTIAPYIVSSKNLREPDGRLRAGVVFSETMAINTLNISNVFIAKVSTGEAIPGSVTIYDGGTGVDYVTTSPADYYIDYQLIVRRTATDLAGNQMVTAYLSPSFMRTPDVTGTTPVYTSTSTTSTTATSTTSTSGTSGTSGSDTATSTTSTTTTAASTTTSSTTYGALSVTTSDSTGQLLAGSYIYIYKTSTSGSSYSMSAITNANGSYMASVPSGTYLVEVYPPGTRTDLAKPEPQSVSVVGGLSSNLSFKFTVPAKTLTGSVRYSDGSPVKDAGISAYSVERSAFINAPIETTGSFLMQVAGGTWKVRVFSKNESGAWTNSGTEQEVTFSGSVAETKFLNFTLPLPAAKLTISATDEGGLPIKNAGINISSVSSESGSLGTTLYNQYISTDTLGNAYFSVVPGAYFIRATVSSDANLINPPEQQVTLISGSNQVVKLKFVKKTIDTTVGVSGKTLKDKTNALGNASVFAWSDQGGVVETKSDSSGSFSFRLAKNSRWHISAAKVIDSKSWKSDESIVETLYDQTLPALILAAENIVLPPSETTTQITSAQIVTQTQDGARMTIPPSSVSAPSVTVSVKPTVEAPSQSGAQVVSTVYDITVKDSNGSEIKTLSSAAEIVLPYDEKELRANGTSEDDIAPSYFDEKTGSWVRLTDFIIDKANNRIIAKVSHFTRFAIVAPADVTPPSGPTKITFSKVAGGRNQLTWVNPAKDFDHSKLYRSMEKGKIGDIIVAETTDTSYVDVNALAGKVYYYTVRSVDPAGNESVNKEQVSDAGTSVIVAAAPTQSASAPAAGDVGYILEYGQRSDNIKILQAKLNYLGFYPQGIISGYFGGLTKAAVIRFQLKYKDEVLTPAGFTRPTGMVGKFTADKINQLTAGGVN